MDVPKKEATRALADLSFPQTHKKSRGNDGSSSRYQHHHSNHKSHGGETQPHRSGLLGHGIVCGRAQRPQLNVKYHARRRCDSYSHVTPQASPSAHWPLGSRHLLFGTS
ncbi:unnamed protein product, partial [Ixodes pacificus]